MSGGLEIGCVRMRESEDDTALEIRDLASRMVQRVETFIRKQKTEFASCSFCKRTSQKRSLLPSEALEEHFTVGEMLPERKH